MRLGDVIALGSLVQHLGPYRIALNALHRWRLRSGWYERQCPPGSLPIVSAEALRSARSAFALPQIDDRSTAPFRAAVCQSADRIVAGELQFFGYLWRERPRSWRQSALSGYTAGLEHWSKLTDFDPKVGDVKWIWDASRFEWAYVLGRAWLYSKDENYARCFWALLEDWIADNPVNRGPNWKCGQECSLRLLALSWSAGVFASAPATSAQRLETLWSLLAALAERVRASLIYSISQNNNHLLSESLALYAASTSLPEHPSAREWYAISRRQFVRAVLDQFAPDGYYAQHSWTYSRFALRAGVIFMSVARRRGESVPAAVLERYDRAAGLMHAMLDAATGRLPNYGGNDGSNVASMSSCDYLDFRPGVAAALYALRGVRAFDDPLVQEELLWIDRSNAVRRDAAMADSGGALQSGYFRLDGPSSRVYVRCGRYRTRPAHADMLHADVWFGHENVARDAGTYQYFDERGWGIKLEGSAAHNVVTIDGADQMRRYSRFLWVNWARGRVLDRARGDADVHWAGEHDGYRRLGVIHRREICSRGDSWLIIDDILRTDSIPRCAVLHWHLCPTLDWRTTPAGIESALNGLRIEVAAPGGATLEVLEGENALPEGAESLYFGSMSPRTTLKVSARARSAMRFITSIGNYAMHGPQWSATWGERWRNLQRSAS